ncbi:MAG: ABC transporter permease [Candidatus Lambdaproteobacteria bacterium]|nr:ABC transporter permease [Candidatus Lambdaproteobacteria bacterium]
MRTYLVQRLLMMVPTLFLVSVLVFSIMRVIPGDVVSLMFEDLGYADSIEQMQAKLGLNLPFYEQYARWVGELLRGNFGESLWTQRTVASQIAQRLPVTLQLSLWAIMIAIVLGGVIGVVAAVRQDTATDMVSRSGAVVFLSMPTFWLGTLVIVFPSKYLGWSPSVTLIPFFEDPLGNAIQFIVPAAILGSHLGAPIMRMSRAMMLEVLRQDYIRTAWSKGMSEPHIIMRHAVRNAMIPVVTILGIQMAQAFGGSVIMETLFQLPGMGSLLIETVRRRDFPMFQSLVLVLAILVMVVNLLVDLTYSWLDPRIRTEAK